MNRRMDWFYFAGYRGLPRRGHVVPRPGVAAWPLPWEAKAWEFYSEGIVSGKIRQSRMRGCEKISGLLRRSPNRGWRRCKSTKIASCSSLHSPILALSRLASHVWEPPRYGRGIFSQPLRCNLARSLSDLGNRSEKVRNRGHFFANSRRIVGGVTDLLLQGAVRSWDNQNFAIQVPTILFISRSALRMDRILRALY